MDSPKRLWRADLHVHSTFSGDFSTPRAILASARRRGLDAVAITDHDTIDGALAAAVLSQQDPTLPSVIIGEEVSSTDGHVLGLFLRFRIAPQQSAADTVAAIHEQGGLAIAPHPLWIERASVGATLLDRLPFDGVEVANGVPVPSMTRANALARRWQADSSLAATGGSDAHHALAVGWSHTVFSASALTDLASALRAATTAPSRLPRNPLQLARYAALGARRHRGLFRVVF